ncbi:lasso peptide biosynthesis B2 protein [Asticcacaulis sp. DXS10W]|uniref:Lasso peptide biosynthesis B2 protein n=1 Tax=Asticcacaulis currens TaxID=2984210 RepID=A0ABT5IBD4_9CAUL|nr:lasso peptide biosynthesis B2 protein [Asticcacaulis currens]MDC7693501.1 lasso peptide biosynthesis B2 protein [Asticcacaulis currens]
MGYDLANGLSYCFVDGRAVFFDRTHNRYFASTPASADALSRLVAGDVLSAADEAELAALVEACVIRPRAQPGLTPPPTLYSLPTRTVPAIDLPVAVTCGLSVFSTRMAVTLALRLLPLNLNLSGLASRKRRCASRTLAPKGAPSPTLIHGFLGTRRLLSMSDKCLPTSLALCHFLLSHGYETDVVIGVRLRPFAAHAWVQRGEMLLSDVLDNVRPFTPIAVI